MNPAERLLEHFEKIAAGAGDPDFYPITETAPRITVAVYPDSPVKGAFTAFTIGLSHSHPPDGAHREMMIRMKSGDDVTWALACGFIAEQLRDEATFDSGETINFQEAISEKSTMNAFVVTTPLSLPKEDTVVDIGVRRVELVQMVPIYASEREWLQDGGALEEFLGATDEETLMNPRRKALK